MKTESPGPTCADKLKVLADSTRLAVLEALMEEPQYVNQLMDLLHVEQSLLSHHLAQLRDAGLVEGQREGKSVLYQLAPGVSRTRRSNAIELGCCQLSFPTRKSKSR
jgi:DNA-binding transcriptional ArsR family regulator